MLQNFISVLRRQKTIHNGQITRFLSTLPSPTHPEYTILSDNTVPDYQLRITEYRHNSTGAKVITALNQDENKVFAISFPTIPTNSKGIPHIIEHCVLSGSKKYPVQDPFMHMLGGSFQTFLNAMTYNDFTIYPVASTNHKDFLHLSQVYLDATLQPLLTKSPKAFQTEGIHFSYSPDQCLPSGIVYNEMKGAYSNVDYLLVTKVYERLYEGSLYRFNSGGDPEDIRTLTYEEFVRYYYEHYHVSNAHFFFYGGLSADSSLAFLHKELSSLSEKHQISTLREGERGEGEERGERGEKVEGEVLRISSGVDKDMVGSSYLFHGGDMGRPLVLDKKESMLLAILNNSLLFGGSNSLIEDALTASHLGTSTFSFMDLTRSHPIVTIGVKGVEGEGEGEKGVEAVQKKIHSVLKEVVRNGFDKERLLSSCNNVLFQLNEFNTGNTPRGVVLLQNIIPMWLRGDGGKIAEYMQFKELMQEIVQEIESNPKSRLFEDFVEKYFLTKENHKHVLCHMFPDSHHQEKLAEQEALFLQDKFQKATQEMKAESLEDSNKQTPPPSESDYDCIPMLQRSDLSLKNKEYKFDVTSISAHQKLLHCELPTNDIIYWNMNINLSDIIKETQDFDILPLFIKLLGEVDTLHKSRLDLLNEKNRFLGNLDFHISTQRWNPSLSPLSSPSSPSPIGDANTGCVSLNIQSKCLSPHVETMLHHIQEVLHHSLFNDKERILSIIHENIDSLKNHFIHSSDSVGSSRINSTFTCTDHINDTLFGSRALQTWSRLLEMGERDFSGLSSRLYSLVEKITRGDAPLLYGVGCSSPSFHSIPFQGLIEKNFPSHSSHSPWNSALSFSQYDFVRGERRGEERRGEERRGETRIYDNVDLILDERREYLEIPSAVNYVCRGNQIFSPSERVSGDLIAATRWLTLNPLMKKIRLENNAYGCRATLLQNSGTFLTTTYRDPKAESSLDRFDECLEEMSSVHLSEKESLRAVISSLSQMDFPLFYDAALGRVVSQYLKGEGERERELFREEVMAFSGRSVNSLAQRYLEKRSSGREKVVILGNGTLEDPENKNSFTFTKLIQDS